jgi:hypothetical protein
MTPEEAKTILNACRPDGSDSGDSALAEALRLARENPTLGEWFARQQAFDRAVAAKLGQIEPPADLRAAILAGRSVRSAVIWWQQPRWMALAAGFLVLLTTGLLVWPRSAAADTNFMAFVANDALHPEKHGGEGAAAGELQAKLSADTTRLGDGLAVNFDALRSTGCRDIAFRGHDVLEVCFKREGTWFHCYIVRQADFPSLAALAKPAVTELDHVQVATWSDSAHVYLVVGKVGADVIRQLL